MRDRLVHGAAAGVILFAGLIVLGAALRHAAVGLAAAIAVGAGCAAVVNGRRRDRRG